MRRKLKFTDEAAFVQKYPNLSKVVPEHRAPDNRKVFRTLELGFALEGVEIVEAAGEQEAEDKAPAESAEKKPEPNEYGAAFLEAQKRANDARKGKEAPNPETQPIAAAMAAAEAGVIYPPPQMDVTKGIPQLENETVRDWHERARQIRLQEAGTDKK